MIRTRKPEAALHTVSGTDRNLGLTPRAWLSVVCFAERRGLPQLGWLEY